MEFVSSTNELLVGCKHNYMCVAFELKDIGTIYYIFTFYGLIEIKMYVDTDDVLFLELPTCYNYQL